MKEPKNISKSMIFEINNLICIQKFQIPTSLLLKNKETVSGIGFFYFDW